LAKCCALLGAFSSVMDGAWLSRMSKDDADPSVSPCLMGLQPERELDRLVWESLTIGLGTPSFLIGAYRELGDQERWALAQGHLIIQSSTPF
jgi:hypothetical protein